MQFLLIVPLWLPSCGQPIGFSPGDGCLSGGRSWQRSYVRTPDKLIDSGRALALAVW